MSYNNTNNSSSTNNPTQKYTNVENQLLQEYPPLPKNPDVKIIECPLSQSISKTEDNGSWTNQFKEPLFVPKGSEIRVQSAFIESRGINQEILVFDGINNFSSRNDSITHLFSYYVNNSGFNDMLLEYDIKDRAILEADGTTTRTPHGDQGHNYKKGELKKYCNHLQRDFHFCGGNNFTKRIFRTDIDTYFQIPVNRGTLKPNIEALYKIGVREDPFCSGRFLTPQTDFALRSNIQTNRIFGYNTNNYGDMLFIKMRNNRGIAIYDFGYEGMTYQHYVSPQKVGQKEGLISQQPTHYASAHYTYGDIMKIQFGGEYIYPAGTTNNIIDDVDALRTFNVNYGGYFRVGFRLDLNKKTGVEEVDEVYDAIVSFLSTRGEDLVAKFKKHPILLTQDEQIFIKGNPNNCFFEGMASSSTAPVILRGKELFNQLAGPTPEAPYIKANTGFFEISPSPFYSLSTDDYDKDSYFYGFLKHAPTGLNKRIFTNLYSLTGDYKCYQVLPNTGNMMENNLNNLDTPNFETGEITQSIQRDDALQLSYSGGGNHIITKSFTSGLVFTAKTNFEATIKLTLSAREGNGNLAFCLGINDPCVINLGAESETHCLLQGIQQTEGTNWIIKVKLNFDNQALDVSNLSIARLDFLIHHDLNAFLPTAPRTGIIGAGLTEVSKFLSYGQTATAVGTNDPIYFTFNKDGMSYDNGLTMNKPNCFYGVNDYNNKSTGLYDQHFPHLLDEMADININFVQDGVDLLQEYSQGGMFFISNTVVDNTSINDFINNGASYHTTDALFQPRNTTTGYYGVDIPQSYPDSDMRINNFTDLSHTEFEYFKFLGTFTYQVPKAYMSPSDIASDYTNKTHIPKGIPDYSNGKRYTNTDKLGIFQNDFVIPIFSSDFPDNSYETSKASPEYGKMKVSQTNYNDYEPHSFVADTEVIDGLIAEDLRSSGQVYRMYFRNRFNYVRTYDPLDPTRTVFPPLSHTGINNTKLFDGSTTSATPNSFVATEQAFKTTTSNYPVQYATTLQDTKGNILTEAHRISQFAGSSNGITLDYNNSISLFEFSFLHTPYATEFDDQKDEGGNIAVKINYPTIQGVDNIESCSGIKMINWAKPNYAVGMFRQSEIPDDFDNLNKVPLEVELYSNGLNPFFDKDAVGQRFLNKLGFSNTTISSNESNFTFDDVGITGSDIDVSSSIIQSKQATEDTPDIDTNVYAIPSGGIPAGFEKMRGYVGRGLGDKIFYPYGVDDNSGALSKDLTVIRYDFATQRFASKGGLRISGHNTGMGLPNTVGSYTFCDDTTFPISFNPDFSKYQGYTIACGSSTITADNLPVKFDNGYFMLQSSLADNNANYYLGKEGQGLNILSTILKTYISGDFIISFNSPYAFYTKEDQFIGKVDSKIINSNGDVPPNLGENSSVIYQITNYNPRDATEQPTTEDTQDKEYQMLDMIQKFQTTQGNKVRQPSPYEVLQNDIGDLANMIVNPTTVNNDGGIMEQVRDRITQYDIPNMTYDERKDFFTNSDVGRNLYNQMVSINEINAVSEGLQYEPPQIVREGLMNRLRDARQTLHNSSGYNLVQAELTDPDFFGTREILESGLGGEASTNLVVPRRLRGENIRIKTKSGKVRELLRPNENLRQAQSKLGVGSEQATAVQTESGIASSMVPSTQLSSQASVSTQEFSQETMFPDDETVKAE